MKMTHDLATVTLALEDLVEYEGNARLGRADLIAESLNELGQYRSVVVNKGTKTGRPMEVIAGWHTCKGLMKVGETHVSAHLLDVDEQTARRINLIDNHANDLAVYDDAALVEQLKQLEGDYTATGYSNQDLAELLAGLEGDPPHNNDPEDAPDEPLKEPISEKGNLWLLDGDRHRLLVGDSTAPPHLSLDRFELGPGWADMVWTDPPYGVDYVGGTGMKIANDDLKADELRKMLEGMFINARIALRPGGAFYVCAPSGALETTFRLSLDTAGLPLRQGIVWMKDRFVLGRADYHGRHESILYGWRLDGEPEMPPPYDVAHDTILYGWKPGAAHTWEGGRKQDTVWECPRPAKNDLHPTMKPVALVRRAVENNTHPDGMVFDLCGGSGSMAIAAYGLRRRSATIELDPVYADAICLRWQRHTGMLPVLEASGEPVDFVAAAGE